MCETVNTGFHKDTFLVTLQIRQAHVGKKITLFVLYLGQGASLPWTYIMFKNNDL